MKTSLNPLSYLDVLPQLFFDADDVCLSSVSLDFWSVCLSVSFGLAVYLFIFLPDWLTMSCARRVACCAKQAMGSDRHHHGAAGQAAHWVPPMRVPVHRSRAQFSRDLDAQASARFGVRGAERGGEERWRLKISPLLITC